MKENVIIVNCKVPSEAYQILTLLRQEPEDKGFKISHGALVKKNAGELSLEDGFVTKDEEGRGWTGGLIGGLVGLLTGPVGALVGGIGGSLIGINLDRKKLEETAALMEKAGEGLADGDTAVLLLAQEREEAALAEKLKDFQITITHTDAKQLADEIEKSENLRKATERMHSLYGENRRITDGNYDKTLAVKCVNGTFVGKKDRDVIAYKGIPYVGKQPSGEYRWKAPVDAVPDDGVYEAYYFGKIPLQWGNVGQMGSLYPQSEESLFLNVWKAADDGAKKKPVMVWIHGGAFEIGSTAEPREDGANFVQENQDVILVSIEYRMNVFGFLHLSHLPDGQDYPDAQNLGLMDQMMALKWVHENIAGFGGDPDNVTIFGQSAGGGSVSLLPLVEGSHKYIRRVIAQSGNPSLCQSTEQSIANTNKLMDALGCKTVADLWKVEPEKLVTTASALLGMRTAPERDGKFLPLDTYEAYAKGAASDIDFMQGCTKDEFHYFTLGGGGAEGFAMWCAERKAEKMAQLTEEEKALAESYCKDVKVEECFEPDSRLLDQIWFNAPPFRAAELLTNAGGKSYNYYITVESSLPHVKSGHAIELSTLFNHPEETFVTGRQFDKTFGKTMRRMWVQFAKTGNPSLAADQSPDGEAKYWPVYDPENKYVMVFDEFNVRAEKEATMKIVDWDRTYFLTKYYVL
ncbi:MAG: carboxylesterase family protein [Oscillospiraceae bacterium]|nr:carboxylesterase family protein [Oscillospiraceae bacterium]